MRILIFLPQLACGGAERQFLQIADGLAQRDHEVLFVTVRPDGELADELPGTVAHLSLFEPSRGRLAAAHQLVSAPRRLARLVAARRPDVVYSALYHANMHAHRGLGREVPLVWGFRSAHQDLNAIRALAFRYNRRHSADVPHAVFNSHAGERFHLDAGLRCGANHVVVNGIDVDRFHPDDARRAALRSELGFASEDVVVGHVGRLHPLKGHDAFLVAAARLAPRAPQTRFLVVGSGDPDYERRLQERARALGLAERMTFTGLRRDVEAVFNGLDVFVSSSFGEGFSNVVSEALASGTPTVATDVGDSARIVGDPACVVPAGAPEALAEALLPWIELEPGERRRRGLDAAERIRRNWSLAACTLATETILRTAAGLS